MFHSTLVAYHRPGTYSWMISSAIFRNTNSWRRGRRSAGAAASAGASASTPGDQRAGEVVGGPCKTLGAPMVRAWLGPRNGLGQIFIANSEEVRTRFDFCKKKHGVPQETLEYQMIVSNKYYFGLVLVDSISDFGVPKIGGLTNWGVRCKTNW